MIKSMTWLIDPDIIHEVGTYQIVEISKAEYIKEAKLAFLEKRLICRLKSDKNKAQVYTLIGVKCGNINHNLPLKIGDRGLITYPVEIPNGILWKYLELEKQD